MPGRTLISERADDSTPEAPGQQVQAACRPKLPPNLFLFRLFLLGGQGGEIAFGFIKLRLQVC